MTQKPRIEELNWACPYGIECGVSDPSGEKCELIENHKEPFHARIIRSKKTRKPKSYISWEDNTILPHFT